MKRLTCCLASFGLLVFSGCAAKEAPVPRFAVALHAATEEGVPLAGVAFSIGKESVGATGENGQLNLALPGIEGTSVAVSAVCPEGFEAPPTLPALRLTKTRSLEGHAPQAIPFQVRCRKELVDLVVVVKAERGNRLPVLVDGKPVTMTDDDGIAHVLLRRSRSDGTLQVSLDTTGHPALKPLNPIRTFETHEQDAIVLFEQAFTSVRQAAPRVATPRRHVPVRIN